MSDQVTDYARELFATGQINWLTDNFKVVFIDTTLYTFDLSHQFLSAVPVGARIVTSGNLQNKTATGGACNADPIILPSVSGPPSAQFIIVKDVGGDATASPIIIKIDSYQNLPVTFNGGNVTINWPTDQNKIFRP